MNKQGRLTEAREGKSIQGTLLGPSLHPVTVILYFKASGSQGWQTKNSQLVFPLNLARFHLRALSQPKVSLLNSRHRSTPPVKGFFDRTVQTVAPKRIRKCRQCHVHLCTNQPCHSSPILRLGTSKSVNCHGVPQGRRLACHCRCLPLSGLKYQTSRTGPREQQMHRVPQDLGLKTHRSEISSFPIKKNVCLHLFGTQYRVIVNIWRGQYGISIYAHHV